MQENTRTRMIPVTQYIPVYNDAPGPDVKNLNQRIIVDKPEAFE